MSSTTHPHVKVIEGMTAAAISGDKDALAKIFADDMKFNVRGPLPKVGDHDAYAAQGDVARAVRCAFWIAFGLLNSGELARGGGWVDRAQRLLDEAGLDCVEHGHLRYAGGLKAIFSGDGETAHTAFATAMHIGDRFGDVEISTLARIGVGRCLIYMGEV